MQVALFLAPFGDKEKSSYEQVIASLQTVGETLTWEIVTSRLLQECDGKTSHDRSSDPLRNSFPSHALQLRGYNRGTYESLHSRKQNRKC